MIANLLHCYKLEKLGNDYNPREDTCLKAFVYSRIQKFIVL